MRNSVILRRVSAPAGLSASSDVVELSRAVVEDCYPAEREVFDAVVTRFRADPDTLLKPGRLRAPVGMGVEIALLTPYVLAGMTFLSAWLADKLADKAFDSLAQSIRDRLASTLAARHRRRGEGADEPTSEPAVRSIVAQEPALTAAQMNEVTVSITVHLSGRGADPVVARDVAESVMKTLVSGRPGC